MNTPVKIFVVEDDPLISMDIQQTLKQHGYKIIGTAENGADALRKIPETKPDFVLMDICLPGEMDGIEVATKLSQTSKIPLVFLSGLSDEATLQRAKLAMPYGYLIKPFDAAELHSTIEVTLHRAHQQPAPAEETSIEDREREFDLEDNDIERKLEVLSRLKIFSEVPKNELEVFAREATIRSFEAGEFLLNEQQRTGAGFVMLSGQISVTKVAISGKELIVALLGAGDTFGLFYLLEQFNGSSSAKARIASRVLWIPAAAFNELKKRAPSVSKYMAESLALRLVRSYILASNLAHSRVEERIVSTLATLLPELGRGGDVAKENNRIFITRKDLADLTGTTPETAIRVTKHLEREGILDLTRPGIIKVIDLPGLQKLANHE